MSKDFKIFLKIIGIILGIVFLGWLFTTQKRLLGIVLSTHSIMLYTLIMHPIIFSTILISLLIFIYLSKNYFKKNGQDQIIKIGYGLFLIVIITFLYFYGYKELDFQFKHNNPFN